ncbi:hypothetical protein [Sinorhizobium fredii]|uniref:hypothetical protein n=1 Tax=Rhizobium fredii TaxID=380 RepID=UPI003518F849
MRSRLKRTSATIRSALVSAFNVPVIRFIVAAVVMWAVASLLYGYTARRTAVVEALTSTVRIELEEDSRPLALGPYDLCLPMPPDPRRAGPSVHGCAPDLFDIRTYDASLQFPKGSVVEFRVISGRLEIEAVKLPKGWREEEYGFDDGAIFSVDTQRLSEFGQFAASGIVSVGAAPGIDKGTLHSGRYRLYSKTLTGFLIGNVLLTEAVLPSGAFLTFTNALSGKPVIAHLQLSSPASSDERGLEMLAISKTDRVDLKMELFQTEPILLRPSFNDASLKDPLLVLVITILSAVATVRDLLGVRKDARQKQTDEGGETRPPALNTQKPEDLDAQPAAWDKRPHLQSPDPRQPPP